LFEAVARAILIRREPLLLFLDDVQWCDRETLDWLHYVLQFDATAPLLIVATLRQEEADDNEAFSTWRLLLQKHDGLTEVPLTRFDEVTTTVLASSLSEHDLQAAEAARIYRETEGNPLFVVEMMRAGGRTTDRTMIAAEQVLPPKVQATIQYRLSQLSAQAQALIQIAAVIGREFTFEVLARASEANEDALVQGLDELWHKRIVREQGASAYDFSHDKIRVVAYALLSATRRRVLHRKVAEALGEVYAPDLDVISTQIAQHYEIAGQADRAIEFYRRAAQAAQRIYANDEAIGHYRYLLESNLAKYLSPEDVCAIKLALGEVWRVNGQWPQAEAINREALARAEKLGAARLMAQAQRALADVMRLQGHYDAALEWLTRAETGFEAAGDRRGVVSTLWTMGEVYWFKGNNLRSLAALDRQLQIATEINDQRGLCEALDTMGMVYWSQGDWDRSVECCLKSIAIAEPLGYKLVITRAAITLGNVGSSQHDHSVALRWYRTAYEVAREIDDRQVISWALANAANISRERGEFQRALAYNKVGFDINLEINDLWTAFQILANFGETLKYLGAGWQACVWYQWAVELGRKLDSPSYLSGVLSDFAMLRLEQYRIDEAAALYTEAQTLAARVTGERMAGGDTRLTLAILNVQLQHRQGSLTAQGSVMALEQLLTEYHLPEQQAAIHYAAWQIEPAAEFHRAKAADLYRTLGLKAPLYLYRQRYHELTDETLPEPPPLPDLPDVEIPDHIDLEALMTHLTAKADKLFDTLPQG
jgi:tetratricopeptide (TPR) repeat protein